MSSDFGISTSLEKLLSEEREAAKRNSSVLNNVSLNTAHTDAVSR